MPAKILCYELNEVPWRVVDYYVGKRPGSVLARFLKSADHYTTKTVDSGELQPWSTWPTLHRGVANQVHQINFLNQNLDNANQWPPIWQLLTEQNVTTGIFGSLQSYPPVKHHNMLFHIPDTFAAEADTIPGKYRPFQAFNLRQTGENKAVASSVGTGDAKQALGLLTSGIRPASFFKVAKHLFNERREALYKRRRALLQPVLAFDVFLDCLKKEQPEFVTFFSNHVAGIMHRYWKYSFPEDFDYTLQDGKTDKFHAESLMVAMDLFDEHLKTLIPLCEKYGYELMICSSMGQEAIERGEYIPELRMKDFDQLVRALNLPYTVRMNLAMQPDVAFEFEQQNDLLSFRETLLSITDSAQIPLFQSAFEPVGLTLNMKLARSADLANDNQMLVSGEPVSMHDYGLELITRDIGTGYHQPEGIMVWQHNRPDKQQDRDAIDSRRVLPSILAHFGLSPSDYMQPAIKRDTATPSTIAARQTESPTTPRVV